MSEGHRGILVGCVLRASLRRFRGVRPGARPPRSWAQRGLAPLRGVAYRRVRAHVRPRREAYGRCCMVPRALENGGRRMGSAMVVGVVLALVAASASAGQLPCGDGMCGVDEDADACPSDCPPCGVIAVGGGTIDDGDACFGLFGPQEYWRHEVAGESGDLAWTMVTADTSASNY